MTLSLSGLLIGVGAAAAAPGQQIEGWVRLASGQAAAGVQVRLYDLADPTRSLGVATDEAGYFSLAAPHQAWETGALPRHFELFQNYPNPFNPSTTIPYRLPAPAHVRLEVFNLLGQRVATLVDEEQQAGLHTAAWNGTDAAGRPVAAGLYLYRLRGIGTSGTRRMVLLDGPAAVPGVAPTPGIPAKSEAPEPAFGLTVSGPGVVTHVDPDFRAGPWPVEIVVAARAGVSGRAAMKAASSGSRILGDVDANGRVDLLDAILVALYSIDPATTLPNDGDISLGDVNRDGRIDVADVYLIASYSVDPGNPSLPAGIGELLIVVAEGKMYWVDSKTAKVQRANLDGSEVEDLVTTGLEHPTDLALDVAGGKMYWSDRLTDKIQRANLDGSQVEDLVTEVYNVWSFALDVDGGKMYWASATWEPKIQRANLDGSQIEDLVTIGLFQIAGLALDVAGGKMYWTDYGTNKIQRANLDGSGVEVLLATGLAGAWGLNLDFAGGKMYWADWLTNQISRANLDGSQVEGLLLRGRRTLGSLVLVIPEGKMYWTEREGILRANLDGSQVEELLTSGLLAPRGLALDLTGLPEIDVDRPPVLDLVGRQSLEEGETLRIDLVARDPEGTEVTFEVLLDDPGIATVSLSGNQLTISPIAPGDATGTVTASDASGVFTTQNFSLKVTDPIPESRGRMYWTDAGTDKIQRANLDGSQIEDLVTTGLDNPAALALDVSGGKMYWTDKGADKIQRSNLDGSQVEDLVTTGMSSPNGLALDIAEGMMYWTDAGRSRIMRANLDGSRIQRLDNREVWGIGLDLTEGKLYWTDTERSNIGRSNLDGSNPRILVSRGLNIPRSLALDLARGKVYWADPGTIRIQRANLDGSPAEDVIVSGLGSPGIGLAIDSREGKMYWTDLGTKKIQRSNLDGTRIEDLVTGLSDPMGLALEILAPELVAGSPWVNPPDPAPGQYFTLSVAIHNRGESPAPATTLRYFRSTDSTITGDDTEVGTRTVRGLSAPGTSFRLIRLRAPATRGTYYFGACVEPVDGEVETGNNCSPAIELVVR